MNMGPGNLPSGRHFTIFNVMSDAGEKRSMSLVQVTVLQDQSREGVHWHQASKLPDEKNFKLN